MPNELATTMNRAPSLSSGLNPLIIRRVPWLLGVNEGTDLLFGGHLGDDAGGGVGKDDVHPAVPFAERRGQGRH
jgi:hypothetical protein